MKSNKILDSLYYRFDPASKQIKFSDKLKLKHQDILLIINLSKNNQMIFNFGLAKMGGTFLNGTLTLVHDLTGMLATDKLMITVYSDDKAEQYLEQILLQIKEQNELLIPIYTLSEESPIIDSLLLAIKGKEESGYFYKNINTATTTVCKFKNGVFKKIIFNNPTIDAVSIYDGKNTSGAVIAIIDPDVSATPFELTYDLSFDKGLTVVTAGTADITVIYK